MTSSENETAMRETKQLSVRLTDEIAAEVVARSKASGNTVSDVLRELIQSALRTKGEAKPPTNGASEHADPNLLPATVADEMAGYFDSVRSAWASLGDKSELMASAIGATRTETEAVKGEVALLRRDLRTLVGTLDKLFNQADQDSA